MNILFGYTFISLAIAAIDITIACLGIAKQNRLGELTGIVCIMAAVVDIAYLIAVRTEDYFIHSVFCSVYFAAIAILLNGLVIFVFIFTNAPRKELGQTLIKISLGFLVLDVIAFIINPFKEIAIGYIYRGGELAHFVFDMKPLYWVHLIYCYVLIAAVLFMLIVAGLRFAKEYRTQYLLCAAAVIAVALINAIFLFIPDMGIISRLDISVMLYSLAAGFFYWACFAYPKKWLEGVLKNSIFDSLDLGIVLFGHDDKQVYYNDKIQKFMPFLNFHEGGTLDEFLFKTAMDFNKDLAEENFSSQWYRQEQNGENHPFFCDYKRLKNEKGRNLGRLFIFEDGILESDPMTGFHNLEPFSAYPKMSYFEYPVVVTCCDINGLSIINNTYGRTAGDQLISELADRHRKEFPIGTYFIRGKDANLISISNNATEPEVIKIMDRVRANFSGTFQYSIVVVEKEEDDIVAAIEKAENNVAIWKLMDKESIRSDTLNSLISALKECDADTEAHVQRTQNMGIELSRRIGLTDSEEVNLALLCVLHDIGKIGIPLEILNKPGKLTDEEWELMKSHVEKGYEIAMSSSDYAPIAKAIRHHHERWDGKGYPDGLSKETIPLLSRFIAVIDAYDAMISVRPYKRTLTKEEAVKELLKNAGTQFDPKIVNEFVQMVTQDDADFEADIFNTKTSGEDDDERPSSSNRNTPVKLTTEEVHAIPYVKYTLDKDMHVIRYDESFTEFTGYTPEDIRERHLTQGDLIPERNRVLYFAMVSEQLGRNQMAYFEHTLLKKDGSELSVVCLGRSYFDSAVREERSEIIVFDISKTNAASMLYHAEKERAESRLEVWEDTFRRDSLTGLYNHSAFVSEVELKLIENKFKTVLLMIDVDNFKEYNDTYGHRSGDEFLIFTADAVHESLRESDLSGRLGGDEFAAAIFFPKEVSDADIRNRIQEIFDTIAAKISCVENGTTLSMGAAIATEKMTNFTALYDAADAALYSSKDAGKNRINW